LNSSENISAKNENYKENLRIFISDNYSNLQPNKSVKSISITNTSLINKFYKRIKYTPIWINDSININKNGSELITLLSTSYNYGLDTSYYDSFIIKSLLKELSMVKKKNERYILAAKIEILLTKSYFQFGKDLNYGITNKDSSILVSEIPRKKFNIDLNKLLSNSFKTDSLIIDLLALQPQHKEYKNLQKHFANYLKSASLSKEKFKVIPFRKDSLKAFEQSKKALLLHKYIDINCSDSNYILALEKFQIQHGLKPDGLIGKNTAKALSKSPYSNYLKAVVSLEKWRWRNNWNEDYIYINIPSFNLKVYHHNQVQKQLNVVVGKPKTLTPEINDSMKYLMVFPYWNLPYSISSKEVLPKIKKDSNYLKKNGYKLLTNKYKPLDENSINWNAITVSNFNYKIRQDGGKKNALGLIKFIFPNKHSIYIHDTPSKRYFNSEIRDFSHGCIRVQNPLALAKIILETDNNKYSIDSVSTFIDLKKQKQINLNRKIPVYIEYFTCGSDSNNTIVFYIDIYSKDNKMKELMGLNKASYSDTKPALVSK
tara:strand:- start:7569 stop:9194 length:1626 start_codon:yes stop_codon:yes gene_type:complete